MVKSGWSGLSKKKKARAFPRTLAPRTATIAIIPRLLFRRNRRINLLIV
jgi:hypothetical protein